MEYEHRVFLSYAREQHWTPWVRNRFVPRFSAYLEKEFGRLHPDCDENERPMIFVDSQIQTGAHWEKVLKNKVARSQVMVALVCAAYFQREWCCREMALMMERERYCGLEGHDENYGLLIPVRLGDGLFFPDLIKRVQYHDFEDCAYLDIPPGSEMSLRLESNIKKLATTVAKTLLQIPDYNNGWLNFTGEDYIPLLAYKKNYNPTPFRILP